MRLVLRLSGDVDGIVYEASRSPALGRSLLNAVVASWKLEGEFGQVEATGTPALAPLHESLRAGCQPNLESGDLYHSSLVFDTNLILKLYHRVDEGRTPELDVGRFLTDRGFPHAPALAGALKYRVGRRPAMTFGILQGYVANTGNGWSYTLRALVEFLDRIRRHPADREPVALPQLLALDGQPLPEPARWAIGDSLDFAATVGRRTAELHRPWRPIWTIPSSRRSRSPPCTSARFTNPCEANSAAPFARCAGGSMNIRRQPGNSRRPCLTGRARSLPGSGRFSTRRSTPSGRAVTAIITSVS